MRHAAALGSLVLVFFGCGGAESEGPHDPPLPTTPSAERPSLSAAECEARGGRVVGDIGDGRTHRPDYRCDDGQEPIADVPLGIEGAVCCPAPVCPEGGCGEPVGDEPAEACRVDESCRDIQCLRAVTCVRECGEQPVTCGCCPCAVGFTDALSCEAER